MLVLASACLCLCVPNPVQLASVRAMTTFAPLPGTYLTIRLNPVTMVEHLEDSVALDAARQMSVGTYIAYVEHVSRLVSIFEIDMVLNAWLRLKGIRFSLAR